MSDEDPQFLINSISVNGTEVALILYAIGFAVGRMAQEADAETMMKLMRLGAELYQRASPQHYDHWKSIFNEKSV